MSPLGKVEGPTSKCTSVSDLWYECSPERGCRFKVVCYRWFLYQTGVTSSAARRESQGFTQGEVNHTVGNGEGNETRPNLRQAAPRTRSGLVRSLQEARRCPGLGTRRPLPTPRRPGARPSRVPPTPPNSTSVPPPPTTRRGCPQPGFLPAPKSGTECGAASPAWKEPSPL